MSCLFEKKLRELTSQGNRPSRILGETLESPTEEESTDALKPFVERLYTKESYKGEWLNNCKHGYGVQTYKNGAIYEGQWYNGKREGQGALWLKIPGKKQWRKAYTGTWRNDKQEGEGLAYYPDGSRMNGDIYRGRWLADLKEGSGTFSFFRTGRVMVGEWVRDVPRSAVYCRAERAPGEERRSDPALEALKDRFNRGDEVLHPLPPLQLKHPVEVLEEGLEAARKGQTAHRARFTPLPQLFDETELADLLQSFNEACKPDGTLSFLDLRALFLALGVELSDFRLEEVLLQIGIIFRRPPTGPFAASKAAAALEAEALEAEGGETAAGGQTEGPFGTSPRKGKSKKQQAEKEKDESGSFEGKEKPARKQSVFSFEDFARAVALLLDAELMETAVPTLSGPEHGVDYTSQAPPSGVGAETMTVVQTAALVGTQGSSGQGSVHLHVEKGV
uniref:MORN repeat-containing protein 3 n=1 Tax=Chromera velia CCMP2878 TaxID=1169474 RepID=A0A0K6S9H0_9ALVE|eukprot:Cvel_7236.t2-p1 / transcript=Cvel_7236.t2 / gene=Cvel_7236 / organism=Chromera_velia_CCMP2878 / gene_product=MORN repeat-containing protein 3, putative / transcript_product=MORN repeat-containing protein 3, putative / location=Cvel_scaffold373:40558-50765(-) / protein_length=447 / sequence_SO=supercontig / SO=protein_coding / is_pseudo=false